MTASEIAAFTAIQASSTPLVLTPAEIDAITTPEFDDLVVCVAATVAGSKYYRMSPTWTSCEDFAWSTIRKEIGDDATYECTAGQRVASAVESYLFH
jgi:hypothetical protein